MTKRTISEWEELIENYKASGFTEIEWCQRQKINVNTFRDRLSRMRKKAKGGIKINEENNSSNKDQIHEESAKETIEWLECKTKDNTISTEQEKIEVRIGKISIVVKQNFNEDTFLKVCGTLVKLC